MECEQNLASDCHKWKVTGKLDKRQKIQISLHQGKSQLQRNIVSDREIWQVAGINLLYIEIWEVAGKYGK